MNLAEIRKKASRGEVPRTAQEWAAPQAEPAPQPAQDAPAQDAPAEREADAFDELDFEPAAVDPDPLPLASRPWQAETQAFDAFEEELEVFDPAAVILKGRESASFELEVSQQEVLDAASVELLCFRVASEEYAISIMDIKEIIKPREVTEVPRVPSFVRGILSLRGNIIPVFDIKARLGLADGAVSERERIVVVKRENGYAGVLVDEVVQVVRIAEGGIEPPPVVLEGIDREFVLGIGRVSGRMLILLDMEKVLDVGLL
ncbi:chemotaxis protein CheW [Geomonas terrae]|uniref:Chemotaxis protein CheW n=1 Tax=Geomonas terrae TaxID=2562681 RepID=A0A4S1CJQ1_9BACT|nr:chemotaxis protein CheW [Geomonas terrae]TGU73925.1 chemotaxis protein CheW [Geomonas terrae]